MPPPKNSELDKDVRWRRGKRILRILLGLLNSNWTVVKKQLPDFVLSQLDTLFCCLAVIEETNLSFRVDSPIGKSLDLYMCVCVSVDPDTPREALELS